MKLKSALIIAVLLASAGVLAFTLWPNITPNGTHETVKEFVLIAKDMKFHVQGEEKLPLLVRVGDRVRLIVRNEESQPIAHNFAIVGLGLRTDYQQPGASEILEFDAKHEGTLLYACLLHPGLMEGQIKILP